MDPLTAYRQRGFTLIEVVVAFAIFTICVGAIYAAFEAAVHRSARSVSREHAWLTAQSLLARVTAEPLSPGRNESGTSAEGLPWHVDVKPYSLPTDPSNPWHALLVTVRVRDTGSTAPVELSSIELSRLQR